MYLRLQTWLFWVSMLDFRGGSNFLFDVLFIYNFRLIFVQRQHTKKGQFYRLTSYLGVFLEFPYCSKMLKWHMWSVEHVPGTPNNHLKMDVWWNNNFLCKDWQSSKWNNRCLGFQVELFPLPNLWVLFEGHPNHDGKQHEVTRLHSWLIRLSIPVWYLYLSRLLCMLQCIYIYIYVCVTCAQIYWLFFYGKIWGTYSQEQLIHNGDAVLFPWGAHTFVSGQNSFTTLGLLKGWSLDCSPILFTYLFQGEFVGCTPIPTYPVMGNPYISPIARGYLWVVIPKNP